MSMPIIVQSNVTHEQAVTDIIQSVALEEAALARILNAEGQKIQTFIAFANISTSDLLKVNKSVESMLSSISKLESILQSKLKLFEKDISKNN